MGNEPLDGEREDARAELDALRRRAYSPTADIADDPVALARLAELEERERRARLARSVETAETAPPSAEPGPGPVEAGAQAVEAGVHAVEAPPPSGDGRTARKQPHRRRVAVIAGAAVLALVLGGAAWSAIHAADTARVDAVAIPVVSDEPWSTSSKAGYDLYVDHLRGELLATAGVEDFARRAVRESLRPYGSLYGRTVWTGSTTDSEFCMIVIDEPAPIVVCTSTEPAYASERSVALRAVDARSTVGSADSITYTLLPTGRVVAAPTAAVP